MVSVSEPLRLIADAERDCRARAGDRVLQGKKIDPVSASLANALMIRCMDYNDIYWKQDPSHPSDIFPAALACCERARSNGRN